VKDHHGARPCADGNRSLLVNTSRSGLIAPWRTEAEIAKTAFMYVDVRIEL
jgi:hypothetical protein